MSNKFGTANIGELKAMAMIMIIECYENYSIDILGKLFNKRIKLHR